MLPANLLLQNRYQIVRLVGQGGMGAVYEANDLRLGHTVAIKQILRGEASAFEREARLLARLRHSTLPKVTDYFAEEAGQFLVMEFVAGDNLETALARRHEPFPLAEVLTWADHLLDAVAYLHSQHPPVIHRDIKPANLKLTPNGDPILLDFGLAKGKIGQTSDARRSISGYTLCYAAPEQIRGEGTEPRSDLYAIGATFYHLLTGVQPPDAIQRALALAGGKSDPLSLAVRQSVHVPPAVEAVLHKAMALSRDQRYATAAVLRQALQEAKNSAYTEPVARESVPFAEATLPMAETPHPTSKRRTRPVFSRRWLSWMAVILMGALLLGWGMAQLSGPTFFNWLREQSPTLLSRASITPAPILSETVARLAIEPVTKAPPTLLNPNVTATVAPTAKAMAIHTPTPKLTDSPTPDLPATQQAEQTRLAALLAATLTALSLNTPTEIPILSTVAHTYTVTPQPTNTQTPGQQVTQPVSVETPALLPIASPSSTVALTSENVPLPTLSIFVATLTPEAMAASVSTVSTPINPPTPSATATVLPTSTSTRTPNGTQTAAVLQTVVAGTLTALAPTATRTPTITSTPTPTPTLTNTPTVTPTDTPNATQTAAVLQTVVAGTLTAVAPTATPTMTLRPTPTPSHIPTFISTAILVLTEATAAGLQETATVISAATTPISTQVPIATKTPQPKAMPTFTPKASRATMAPTKLATSSPAVNLLGLVQLLQPADGVTLGELDTTFEWQAVNSGDATIAAILDPASSSVFELVVLSDPNQPDIASGLVGAAKTMSARVKQDGWSSNPWGLQNGKQYYWTVRLGKKSGERYEALGLLAQPRSFTFTTTNANDKATKRKD